MGEEAENPTFLEQDFSGGIEKSCCGKSLSVSKAVQVEHLMIPKVI